MSSAWIGLGSNLGDPPAQLRSALKALDDLPGTFCRRRSGLYRSAPVGPQDQPDFCNAVAELETELGPQELLDELLAIENSHDRRRKRQWGPRTLDLDLLLYEDREMNTPCLQLPHPRMHERAFVLAPLAALAPDLAVPGQGRVTDLLARVADQAVTRWTA